MTGRERIINSLNGKKTDKLAVNPHGWGPYKFQHAGIATGYEDDHNGWRLNGAALSDIDEKFCNDFELDMIQMNTGAGKYNYNENLDRERIRLLKEVRKQNSFSDIDRYFEFLKYTEENITDAGIYSHVTEIKKRVGDRVYITLNEGNPSCGILDPYGEIGFIEGMIALVENPRYMEYFFNRSYEHILPRMKSLAKSGADAYIGSETYCAADLISPDVYRSIIFCAQKTFYEKISDYGLTPIVYFCGDVNPIIDDIKKLGAAAVMVEESKKDFVLDVVELARKLDGQMALFGNLDSIYTLLMGSTEDVRKETLRQAEASKYTPFIMANGSPIAFDTPAKNIRIMIQTTREYII